MRIIHRAIRTHKGNVVGQEHGVAVVVAVAVAVAVAAAVHDDYQFVLVVDVVIFDEATRIPFQ